MLDIKAPNVCDFCLGSPAPYRITDDDGQRVYLCRDCRDDVEYSDRKGYEAPRP